MRARALAARVCESVSGAVVLLFKLASATPISGGFIPRIMAQHALSQVVVFLLVVILVHAAHLANARGDAAAEAAAAESPRLERARLVGDKLLEVRGYGLYAAGELTLVNAGDKCAGGPGGALERLEVDELGTRAVFELRGDVSEPNNDDLVVCVGGAYTGVKVQIM